ncbi:MAG: molybdopterin molybdotransferase MoeA, partial [Thermoplasmata archaeon]
IKSRCLTVPARDSAGYYSYEDIRSPVNFPGENRSAVDGYALKFEETLSSTKTNPMIFKLMGAIGIGDENKISINHGECMKVFTGSPIPEGADTVVMKEDTDIASNEVRVFKQARKFQNISLVGEDLKIGDVIIAHGRKIEPWHIPAFVEAGIESVKVTSARIGILSTGDELVNGKVKNSSAPMIVSLIKRKGFDGEFLGNVRDDPEEIETILDKYDGDIIILTGGSGPSERDIVHSFLQDKGKIFFHGMRMKPGRTTGFGEYAGKPVFMISGLPVASLIAYENVIDPALNSWFGIRSVQKKTVTGRLERSIYNNDAMKMFVRVSVSDVNGTVRVDPLRVTGSGVISSVIRADGYLVIDENVEGYADGEEVKVDILE